MASQRELRTLQLEEIPSLSWICNARVSHRTLPKGAATPGMATRSVVACSCPQAPAAHWRQARRQRGDHVDTSAQPCDAGGRLPGTLPPLPTATTGPPTPRPHGVSFCTDPNPPPAAPVLGCGRRMVSSLLTENEAQRGIDAVLPLVCRCRRQQTARCCRQSMLRPRPSRRGARFQVARASFGLATSHVLFVFGLGLLDAS